MPRVYIYLDTDTGTFYVNTQEGWGGVPVEMNNSLYRQIKSAIKKYDEFQERLGEIYETADSEAPNVRRVT